MSSSPRARSTRAGIAALALLLGVAPLLTLVAPAYAASAGWAGFTFTTGDKTGTMTQQPVGFPRADIVTDSALGGVGVQSGATTFLAAQTPPGQKYGTSQGSGYLNLRPAGRTTAAASITTYTFAKPTPATGWTFVLGDIDADQVTITATDADGAPVDPAALGYQSSFNYCAPGVTPKPGCAPPNNDGSFLPTWNATTGVLVGDNPQFRDTAGSSAWFEPTVALSSLTFAYALRKGSPVYQTWFAAQEFNLTGTVTAPAGAPADVIDGLELRLLDRDGNEVATTQTRADGSYSFPGLATYADYQVSLAVPDDYTLVNGQDSTRTVNLSTTNQVEDFDLRAVTGRVVSGVVATPGGDPVAGVTVTLTGNGQTLTATTDAEGRYVIDNVPAGAGYTLTASDLPDNTTVDGPFAITVPANTDPADQDFVVTPIPRGTLSGTVTRDGTNDPLPNVLIVVSGPGGDRDVRTDEDGNWTLDDLEPGDYTATVQPEGGNTVVGASTRTRTITSAGETRTGLDFVLAAPPVERLEASGTVEDENGDPVAGATVTATDPFDGEEFTDVTGADGTWSIDGLYPDTDWTATVDPPAGYEVVGERTVTFDLLDDATGIRFVLERVATATPTATPTASPTATQTDEPTEEPTTSSGSGGTLADTGGPALPFSIGALLLVVTGLTVLRVRRRH